MTTVVIYGWVVIIPNCAGLSEQVKGTMIQSKDGCCDDMDEREWTSRFLEASKRSKQMKDEFWLAEEIGDAALNCDVRELRKKSGKVDWIQSTAQWVILKDRAERVGAKESASKQSGSSDTREIEKIHGCRQCAYSCSIGIRFSDEDREGMASSDDQFNPFATESLGVFLPLPNGRRRRPSNFAPEARNLKGSGTRRFTQI